MLELQWCYQKGDYGEKSICFGFRSVVQSWLRVLCKPTAPVTLWFPSRVRPPSVRSLIHVTPVFGLVRKMEKPPLPGLAAQVPVARFYRRMLSASVQEGSSLHLCLLLLWLVSLFLCDEYFFTLAS